MKMRWVTSLLAVMMLVMLVGAPRGEALSCMDPRERYGQMEVVVKATVVKVEKQHWAHLKVERYYRGQGPESLVVEYRGTDNRYSWARGPRAGANVLLELRRDGNALFSGPCDLEMDYQPASAEVQKALTVWGEGTAPTPGGSAQSSSSFGWLVGGAVVLVAAGGFVIYRRMRK